MNEKHLIPLINSINSIINIFSIRVINNIIYLLSTMMIMIIFNLWMYIRFYSTTHKKSSKYIPLSTFNQPIQIPLHDQVQTSIQLYSKQYEVPLFYLLDVKKVLLFKLLDMNSMDMMATWWLKRITLVPVRFIILSMMWYL